MSGVLSAPCRTFLWSTLLLAHGDREAARQPLYSGTCSRAYVGRRARVRRLHVAVFALTAGGCSFRSIRCSPKADARGRANRLDRATGKSEPADRRRLPRRTSPMRARPLPRRSRAAARIVASRGRIRIPAPAATSRRWPPPISEGGFVLPRFPGELCARPIASVAQGRGLPHGTRRMGSQEPEAAETELTTGSSPSRSCGVALRDGD